MALRQQQLEVHLPPSATEVDGDPMRLAQVLNNLLDNASRYTPEGGRITLSVGAEGGAVVISVADNGIGITAQALPGVFGPFGQDVLALDFNGTGLGLGLTVVRALVEAHGGSVVAHSAGSRQGSRFVVTLPLAGATTAAGARPDAGRGDSGR
jgi:signal transduction histidine kinase